MWRYVLGCGAVLIFLIYAEVDGALAVGLRPRGAIIVALAVLVGGSIGVFGVSWLLDRFQRRK